MGASQRETVAEQAGEGSVVGELKLFINYRHDDADAAALLLYERLAARFGEANVFLDVKSLELGTRWLEGIRDHGARSGAFLALIGRGWLESLTQRHRAYGEGEDYVLLELELALRKWRGQIVPVLIGGAAMPSESELPKPLKALARYQASELRMASFDADVKVLIEHLEGCVPAESVPAESVPAESAAAESTAVEAELRELSHGPLRPRRTGARAASHAPSPGEDHYEQVLECMVEEGTVVPVLGSRVWGCLPGAQDLAAYLVDAFKLQTDSRDLAEVAQHVALIKPSLLYKTIHEALRLEGEPNGVHRFLAGLPKRLEALGRPSRYQMIVTTCYDTALERAFDAVNEPYDVAVFVAGGGSKGEFVHEPWKGEATPVADTAKYLEFPIDKWDELTRTVIVKVHGAAYGHGEEREESRNYVLTEDQYIDYMVADEIASVIPKQILNKLKNSHCLFLGYAMRDWSPRVFLKRVWPHGQKLEDSSWAIEYEPEALEHQFWKALQVELFAALPDDYVSELDARMDAWRAPAG